MHAWMTLVAALCACACSFQQGDLGGTSGGDGRIDVRSPDDSNVTPRKCTLLLGSDHSCSIRTSDSTLWCVGDHGYGQLGYDPIGGNTVTTAQLALGAIRSAGVRFFHVCASFANGSAQCWGQNDRGQLGDDTFTGRGAPAPVMSLANVAEIVVGRTYSCVRRDNGTVTCWGDNVVGQLGDGTKSSRILPTIDVVGLTAAPLRLAPGASHVCALLPGAVGMCWGANAYGQLGNGTQTDAAAAIAMPVTDIAQIAANGYSTGVIGAQTCALSTSGTVSCWGSRDFGQLGNGEMTAVPSLVPVAVSGVTDGVELVMGRYHACVRRSAGQVACWGRNEAGEIGDGTYDNKAVPTAITLPHPAVHIAAGGYHTCALLDDDSVWCWGANARGQLADGSILIRPSPVASSLCP